VSPVAPATPQRLIGESRVDEFAFVLGDGPVQLLVRESSSSSASLVHTCTGSALLMAAMRSTASFLVEATWLRMSDLRAGMWR